MNAMPLPRQQRIAPYLRKEKGWIKKIEQRRTTPERIARQVGLHISTVRRRLRRAEEAQKTGKIRPVNKFPGKQRYQRKPKSEHKKPGRQPTPIGELVRRLLITHGKGGDPIDVRDIYEQLLERVEHRTNAEREQIRRSAIKILSRMVAEGKIKRTGTRTVQLVIPPK